MSDKLFSAPSMTLVFISFLLGLSEFIVLGISENIAGDLGESVSRVVLLITVFAWAYAVSAPLLTSVTAGMDRRRVFLVFLAVFLIANSVSFASATYLVLAVSRIVTAAVSGVLLAMALGYVPLVSAPQNIPKTIAFVFAGFSIACTVGLPVGNVIASEWGWQYTFLVVVVLSVAAVALASAVLPREEHHPMKDHGPQPRENMFSILKDGRILLTMLFSITGVGGAYVFFSAIQPLMNSFFGYDTGKVTLGLLAFGVAAFISNVSSSAVAEKGGYRALRIVALLQMLVFLGMVPALDAGWTAGMLMILAMGLVMYLMNSANQMHYMEIAATDYPQSIRLASSFNPMTFNLGIGIGAAVCSAMMESGHGFADIAVAAAVVSAISLVAVLLIVRTEKDEGKRTSLYGGVASGKD